MDKVEDIVLTVVNDGNGSLCGFTYGERLKAATKYDKGASLFFRAASIYIQKAGLYPSLVGDKVYRDTIEARDRLIEYYQDHLMDIQSQGGIT